MKNIHVLKTDKPSRLLKSDFKITLLDIPSNEWKKPNINIYITSDEEIKEGDWVMEFQKGDNIGEVHFINSQYVIARNIQKKIILTTDQDLIKDGVQAIDDEFLEWFVKNPSCESVEVRKECCGQCDERLCEVYDRGIGWNKNNTFYEIIIPKEEPKQETLEEASKKYALNRKFNMTSHLIGFRKGAKWQAERMYSEEEVHKILGSYSANKEVFSHKYTYDMWFEQFKKK